jgi:FAD dependent oxidoreductase
VAAALAAAARGVDVVLTERGDLLGGQLTAQAVPPDEHPWIEQFGCTASYRGLRDAIRAYYRAHYPLTEAARARRALNPGAARVSHLAHEPRVAAAVIDALLAPHRSAGRVRVLRRHAPVATEVDGDRIVAVTFDRDLTVTADWVIDATETGDLLPLCGAEHVTGAESREETGEPHAPATADGLNMQPVSVCFALDHLAGQDHTIPRPAGYERFSERLSLVSPDPKTLAPVQHTVIPNPGGDPALVGPDYADERAPDRNLWTFRRIAARDNFLPGAYASDITLVNWPQIDYTDAPVFDVADDAARTLSLSFLHWLQTEGGLPGLRLRGDVVWDTDDGLAPDAYIRESRRIRAEHTVVEQEIALDVRGERGAVEHRDSVGIGSYRIDLHPSTAGDPYIDIPCCPFQLPLGALIPVRLDNLLPGAKNIGTTHITNGSHRLHPVEWNVGEVAGTLAAFCAARRVPPRAVRSGLLEAFQAELVAAGVELRWPRVSGY